MTLSRRGEQLRCSRLRAFAPRLACDRACNSSYERRRSAFPYRDAILFLTFAVILVTLVGQGLTLPFVIRLLGLANTGEHERRHESAQERAARHEAIEAALAQLARLEQDGKLSESSLMDSAHVTMIAGDNLNIAEESIAK